MIRTSVSFLLTATLSTLPVTAATTAPSIRRGNRYIETGSCTPRERQTRRDDSG
jgi:hypothetical protein